jgi:NADPH-dependent ferric siderophore reductase
MTRHEHRMLRHQIAIRRLEVMSAKRMTPHMQRITLQGEALRGFVSASPDDHVKLVLPNEDGELVAKEWIRTTSKAGIANITRRLG